MGRKALDPPRGKQIGVVFEVEFEVVADLLTSGISVSRATVYNTLHQFTEAGLLHETAVEPGRSYFDINTADHHHFFCDATGKLDDIPAEQLSVSGLPLPPAGTEIRRVDIIVRIRPGGVDHLY